MRRQGSLQKLEQLLGQRLGKGLRCERALGELSVVLDADSLVETAAKLRDDPELDFDQLIDICGVDYQEYGKQEWDGSSRATRAGFSRAVDARTGARRRFEGRGGQADAEEAAPDGAQRIWGVYHLLSHKRNWRLRLKVAAQFDSGLYLLDSLVGVWPAADWFEREAFDLFGLHFRGHPDLRRLLTDYGFIGHPMRKDFPLIGEVEVRYDPEQQRVIYQAVSIEPRVLVPRVIRPAPDAESSESGGAQA